MIQFEILLGRIIDALQPLATRLGVPADQLAHALGCALLSAVFMLFGVGPFTAFLATVVIGFAWEGSSYVWRKVEPDPQDVLADFIGAAPLPAIVGLIGLLA